jgi:hypothetical protein
MSVLRKSSLAALALLFVATTAQAVSYTVTLSNGTSFETRYKPMTAEWDANFAMLRTDQGNWIALKKSEIVDVASSAEVSGFGYQIDETTVFLGWSATEGFVGEDGSGDGAGGAAPGTAPAPAGSASSQAAPSGGGSGFTMQQFVSVPSTGVIPGGIPLGGGSSAGGTEAGLPAPGGGGG